MLKYGTKCNKSISTRRFFSLTFDSHFQKPPVRKLDRCSDELIEEEAFMHIP